ncbi:hypothetical protein CsSME_00019182 [Camellia sinensis var. sinensis]
MIDLRDGPSTIGVKGSPSSTAPSNNGRYYSNRGRCTAYDRCTRYPRAGSPP